MLAVAAYCVFYKNKQPAFLDRKAGANLYQQKDYVLKVCEKINSEGAHNLLKYLKQNVADWGYLYQLNWLKIFEIFPKVHKKVKIWTGQLYYPGFDPVYISSVSEYVTRVDCPRIFPNSVDKIHLYMTALLGLNYQQTSIQLSVEEAMKKIAKIAIEKNDLTAFKFVASLSFGNANNYQDELNKCAEMAKEKKATKVEGYLKNLCAEQPKHQLTNSL